jgi:hypothetical protein
MNVGRRMYFGALERSSIISVCVCTLPHTCCVARILEEEEDEEDLDILRQILEQVVFPISAKNHRACEFFECKNPFKILRLKLYKNSCFFPPSPSQVSSVSFWS